MQQAPTPALRRSLLLRDATTFLALGAITIVLFGITLALFRSFEAHREALGRRWTAQARAALARHDPEAAVPALRAALSYAPDDRANQLLLAEALAGSGHENEAASYFLNLWTARPGDGFVNLQLARLARRRGDAAQATEYYRAAIFGDWGEEGPQRRRDCRLELAAYLTDRGDLRGARDELLIVERNAPADVAVLLPLGEHLAAAGDFQNALNAFERALAIDPGSDIALLRAEAAALLAGAYSRGEDIYAHAERETSRSPSKETSPEAVTAAALAQDAARLSGLSLSRDLPPSVKVRHLLSAADLAQSRLRACSVAPAGSTLPADLTAMNARWRASARDLRRRAAAGNAEAQDSLQALLLETAAFAAQPSMAAACGQLSEDDLLLLLLARSLRHGAASSSPALADLEEQLKGLASGQTSPSSTLVRSSPFFGGSR